MRRRRKNYSPHWRPGLSDKRRHRRRIWKTILKIILWVVLIVLILGTVLFFLPVGKSSKKGYAYIQDDTTLPSLCEEMKTEIGLSSFSAFKFYAQIVSLEKRLRPGRYTVNGSMSSYTLLKKLIRGGQDPITVSFSSVRTLDELTEKLTKPLQMSSQNLQSLLANASYCDSLGFDTTTIKCLFLPNSYEVYWNVSPRDLVEKIHKYYLSFWNEERRNLATKEGLTPIEVSIIASIVEEESNKLDEYSRIAGLYINRLRRGIPLQADPTVKYAVGDFTLKRITYANTSVDSPYNTYRILGLPPGPIRFPSEKTLDAVLHFEKHSYLYMCAKSDLSGYHDFAIYYNEHLANAYRYQRKLDSLGITATTPQ